MSSAALLPPNATTLERNAAIACADAEALPVAIRAIHNPQACPPAFLPWLAWAYSVDEWVATWPEYRQRQAVADALELHRRKGTVWAVKRVIGQQGFILRRLYEHAGRINLGGEYSLRGWHMPGGNPAWGMYRLDGTAQPNGYRPPHGINAWAMYRIVLSNRRVTRAQLDSLRRALAAVAPVRCLLVGIHWRAEPIRLNGTARLNGEYNLGSIYT